LASAEDCGSGSFRLSRLLLDRWPLPARSSRSSRSPALSWPVGVDCSASPFHEMWAFVIFSSPSEHSRLCQNSSRPPKRSEFFLSWDSPALRPSAVRLPMRPLPEACAPFGPTVRPGESCSARVVAHHLDGLLRVGSAGLVRPAAGLWGSSRFPAQPGHLSVSGNPAFRSPRRGISLRRVPLVSSRFCIAASFCLPVVSVRPRVSSLLGCPSGLPSEEEWRGLETSR
jgi:hypothetical protein